MHPRTSSPDFPDPSLGRAEAVTHAQVARRLVQRAARHLKQIENLQECRPADSDCRLIRQALERLAVADLLIDAYAGPTTPATEVPGHENGGSESLASRDAGGLVPGRPGNQATGPVR